MLSGICHEPTLERSRAPFCRSSEGRVVRGFVRGSLVWSIMGCFQYKESRKKGERMLMHDPMMHHSTTNIFHLIFAWSKARIRESELTYWDHHWPPWPLQWAVHTQSQHCLFLPLQPQSDGRARNPYKTSIKSNKDFHL